MLNRAYLLKRDNTWYVQVPVPPPLCGRTINGRKVPHNLVKTLQTQNLKEASQRKYRWITEFKRQIADWESQTSDPEAAKIREDVLALTDSLIRYKQRVGDGRSDELAEISRLLDAARNALE